MQTKPLTLNRVEIKRNPSYESSNPNRFIAEIEYQSGGSELKLLLDPGVSEQILGFIGPVITKFATKAAQDVEANIAQAVEDLKPAIQIAETSATEAPEVA